MMLVRLLKFTFKGPATCIHLLGNLKLKAKLFLAFLIVLLLCAISIGTYHTANLSNTRTYQSLIEIQQSILVHAAAAKLSLLQCLVHEKNFIFQKSWDEEELIWKHLNLLKTHIRSIKGIREGAGAPEKAVKEMDRILARIDKYENVLKKVIPLLTANGFDVTGIHRQLSSLDAAVKSIDKRLDTVQEAAQWNMDRKLEEAALNTRSKAVLALGIGGGSFLLSILLALTFSWRINTVLGRVIVFTGKMSKGDFTQFLDLRRKDEFGLLAGALNQMVENLGQMIRQMTDKVVVLTGASSDLSGISEQMSQNANQTARQADSVAAATEEMSTSMKTVAATSEQTTSDLSKVSAATEEMSVTVGEIARNTEKANSVVSDMIEKINDASTRLDELGNAAKTITSVTDTIADISDQTNLLALNATIEAARAGEAGKGFAVVAAEIKDLANQTAASTQDIKRRIDGIQTSTRTTVRQVLEMTDVAGQVSQIVTEIAAAVAQQAQTTTEIASSISHVSDGIKTVNDNIISSSAVAGEIAGDVVEVNQSAEKMSQVGSRVNTSAEQLSAIACDLATLAGAFHVAE